MKRSVKNLKSQILLKIKTVSFALLYLVVMQDALAADIFPSWNNGASRQALIQFVESVTKEGSAPYVPITEGIAVYDNDGTLRSEQPVYF